MKNMKNLFPPAVRKILNGKAWAYGIFWSWNIIFLVVMFFGFAPQVVPPLLRGVQMAGMPTGFLAYAFGLTLIPLAATVLGLTALRRAPGRLLAFGYGIEGPLMLMLALRFFFVHQMTPGLVLLMSVAGLGMAALLWQLLDPAIDRRPAWAAYLRVAGLTLLLFTGLYVAVWLTFYLVPALGESLAILRTIGSSISDTFTNLGRTVVRQGLSMGVLAVLGLLLGLYSATLLLAMPVAGPVLYVRAWLRGLSAVEQARGRPRATLAVAAAVAATALFWALAVRQPQTQAFALLRTAPTSPAQAQALLDRQNVIRAGLLNAYLANFRYPGAVGDVRHVREMYRSSVRLAAAAAARVQALYDEVARPMLYAPVNSSGAGTRDEDRALRKDAAEAARLYEAFFDRNILDAEQEPILQAVRSTWMVDQAESAAQVVDEHKVHLAQQEVSVTEHGDWADVELYEVYENQTSMNQEVLYYFSLPESAAITGLWLGSSPDRAQRFPYRVSPRGAAQAVYRNEVRYYRDPALVEQIGPRQYRLRIFPVAAKRWQSVAGGSPVGLPPQQMHMWLTWRVLAKDGAWPMPRLAEKHNVYWDGQSVRLVSSKAIAGSAEEWLPSTVPAMTAVKPASHRVDLPGGQTVLARPVSAAGTPAAAGSLRLAVVLDRSRSMARFDANVKSALARLAQAGGAPGAVDAYLTSSVYRGEPPSRTVLAELEANSIMYYGGQDPAELLAQYAALQKGEKYDAVFVLTDGAGYKLGSGTVAVPIPAAPVWMVHLTGEFPLGYDDAMLQAIQASGGGVAGSVEEALSRLSASKTAGSGAQDVIDGYLWSAVPTAQVPAVAVGEQVTFHAAGDGFTAFAARRLALAETARQRGALADVAVLDRLHALAREQSIVTPYSSMIVLVTEGQAALLDRLEAAPDRFQREYEQVGETKAQQALLVTAVPEPEEWLLLALAAGLLAWYWRSTRRSMMRVPRP